MYSKWILPEKRKNLVFKCSDEIIKKHGKGKKARLDDLANEKGIEIVRLKKCVDGSLAKIKGDGYYIVVPSSCFQIFDRYVKAHEIGLFVLEHSKNLDYYSKEEEADCFVEQITGMGYYKQRAANLIQSFYHLIRNPIISFKYAFFEERYNESLKRELRKKLENQPKTL
jgi:hypothetical protein